MGLLPTPLKEVEPQQLPTATLVSVLTDQMVLIEISNPGCTFRYLLGADDATRFAENILAAARVARTGLVLPPSHLVE